MQYQTAPVRRVAVLLLPLMLLTACAGSPDGDAPAPELPGAATATSAGETSDGRDDAVATGNPGTDRVPVSDPPQDGFRPAETTVDGPGLPPLVLRESRNPLYYQTWRLARIERDDGSVIDLPDGELDPGYRMRFVPGDPDDGRGVLSGTHLCDGFEAVFARGDGTLRIDPVESSNRDCPSAAPERDIVERVLFDAGVLMLGSSYARLVLTTGDNVRLTYLAPDRNVSLSNVEDFRDYVSDDATVIGVSVRFRRGEPWTTVRGVAEQGERIETVTLDPVGRPVDESAVPAAKRGVVEEPLVEVLQRTLDPHATFDVMLELVVEVDPVDPSVPLCASSGSTTVGDDGTVIDEVTRTVDGVPVDEATCRAADDAWRAERGRLQREADERARRRLDRLAERLALPDSRVLGPVRDAGGAGRFLLTRSEIEAVVRDPPEGLGRVARYAEPTIEVDG